MTRRKRLGFVSRACIGMFLLLFGEIAADTTNEPQTVLRKNFEGATDKQSPLPANETFAGKNLLESNGTKLVSSPSFASASLNSASPLAPEGVEGENVGDRTDRGAEREKTAEDYVAAKKTGPDRGNVPTSPSPLNVASTDHDLLSDKSSLRSTMDSVSKRFKLDNLRENVDKGSSTNAASKESTRLSKMNNLDTATASEVSTSKHGDKVNGTVRVSEFRIADQEDADHDREPTTQSNVHHELFNEEKTNSEDPVQEARDSERFNLENAGKTEDVEGGISLLNDTRVNYGHPRENRTGGSANSGQEETDSSTENPKEEIELIKNISRSSLLKLILKSNGTSDKNHAQTNGTAENELEDKGGPEVSEMRQKLVHNANLNASTDSDKDSSASTKSDQASRKETQAVSPKAKDDLNDGRGIVLTTMSNPSLLPKGRTIAFSGVNEFSSNEDKTSPFAGSSKDTANGHDYRDKSSEVPSKKNTSGEKVDQKSYPYVKSTKTLPQEHTERSFVVSATEHSDMSESTSEESLAYENTISRRQESETKFVVTEPSVVIENSIQQFKSTYDKRSGNASDTEFTVKSQSFAGVTPTSSATLDKDAIANGTLDDEKKSTGLVFENARTTDVEDAPRRTDIIGKQKEITGKDENFDVTGNGITEISPKLNEPSYGPSFFPDETLNSTTVTSTLSNFTKPADNVEMSTNVDVQTDAEESLLLRSTLNVTETSTEYPLLKANSTEDTGSTTTTINPSTNSITFATLNDTTPPTLVTSPAFTTTFAMTSMTSNETSNDTTRMSDAIWSFNESSTPTTTTTIEYEFVGLTESVDQITENVTTDKTPAAIDDHTHNYTAPASTVPPLSVDDITTIVYPTSLKATLETNSEDTTTTFPSTTEIETTVDDKTIFTIPEDQILENETTLHSTLRSVSPSIIDDRSNSTKDLVGNVNSTDSDSSTTIEFNTAHPSEAANSNVSASSEAPSTLLIDTSSFPSTDISLVPSDSRDTYHPNMVTTSNTTQSSFGADVTTRSTAHFPFVPSTLRPRILQSTWSSSSGGPVLAPTGKTVENNQGPLPDNVPLLVRIVIEGSLSEVCPHLQKLAQFLVDMLNAEVDKPVSEKQVIFHQNPCTEPQNPAPTSTDMSFTSILVYIVDEEGKFDMAKTKMLPNLYKGTPVNIPVTIRSFLLVQDSPDSGNAIAVVIVCSVAFICLVLLASLLFIMRKRQTRFNYGERCRPVSLDAYSLDSVSAYNSVRRKGVARSSKRSYGNPTFEDSSAIPSHPLNFAGLSSFHTDVNAINEEFSSIPQVWAKIDELPAGAEVKNRYANVIPLPETRVPLQRLNNDPLSEYVNANYVRGPKNATKYYIACQAPMEATVTDFWRMIWEQQSKVIIMLTDFVENGIDKCTEYIPPSEVTDCHRLYGDFQVTLKKRETKEKYAISTLHLKNLENNTFREVFHIWYLWPVNGVQSDGTGLIAILLEARALQRGGPGPIVVHCSPGTGRTGTLIALDLGIRQYEITRTVDVPRVVCTIRRDRAGAVQTKEQYAFIYKALNLYATKLAGGVLEST